MTGAPRRFRVRLEFDLYATHPNPSVFTLFGADVDDEGVEQPRARPFVQAGLEGLGVKGVCVGGVGYKLTDVDAVGQPERRRRKPKA